MGGVTPDASRVHFQRAGRCAVDVGAQSGRRATEEGEEPLSEALTFFSRDLTRATGFSVVSVH